MSQSRSDQEKAQHSQSMQAFFNDPKFQEVAKELQDNPPLRQQIAADPAGHFKSKGLNVPQGVKFTLNPSNWCVQGCVTLWDNTEYCCGWSWFNNYGCAVGSYC